MPVQQKPSVTVSEVDRVYTFDGLAVKEALATVGVSQAQLSELCGFTGAAHVCRLLNSREARVHGESFKRIASALRTIGISVVGFPTAISE
jgi:hypothetical protein